MTALLLVALLAPGAAAGLEAEVVKGVAAYNARDLVYYEAALAPDVVYIAEDGAVMSGKERVLRLFGRIFSATPPRQLAVAAVTTGGKGEVAWARFKWTLTIGEETRKGVGTTLFVRSADRWQVVQIQNTPDGHAMPRGAQH
jgi:ketosteroid isomerase-like protein